MSRKEWLIAVGEATAEHREQRAGEYGAAARKRRRTLRERGFTESYVENAVRWHTSRARGQLNRIDTVADCGVETLSISCQNCARCIERPAKCRALLLCVSCRGRIAWEKRTHLKRCCVVLLADARRRGLLNHHRRGGRWSQKLLTLTAPHIPGDTIPGRIKRVLAAWRLFLKHLNAHLCGIAAHKSSAWFRVFEWTPGDDDLGHPHLHIWFFGPFLEQPMVRDWWAAALGVELVVVDIREIHDPDGAAQEVIKYLTKDIDANGHVIPSTIYAEVYKALDGGRLTQSSSGFKKLAGKGAATCECGVSLPKRVRRVRPTKAPKVEPES